VSSDDVVAVVTIGDGCDADASTLERAAPSPLRSRHPMDTSTRRPITGAAWRKIGADSGRRPALAADQRLIGMKTTRIAPGRAPSNNG
jgi:hypothetical protein